MEPCASTEAHLGKVLGKISAYQSSAAPNLQSALAQLATLKQELLLDPDAGTELSVTGALLFEQALERLRGALKRLSAEHKEIHGSISKTGKEIDKNFTSDFSGVIRGNLNLETDELQKERVNRLIAQHFLTQGHLDMAELLSKESRVSLEGTSKSGFLEMNDILGSLERRELDSAIAWAQRNSQSLQVCQLMGAVMFAGPGLGSSPYAHLLDKGLWLEARNAFRRDSCALLSLPPRSPLSQVLDAGTVALPALLNLRAVMESRHVLSVWGNDELPMDIDLGPEAQFHSVFSCPILKQQTTNGNPPMRLTCGHAISKDALSKLSTSQRSRLKCPYCPVESLVADAKRVYF